MAPSRLFAFERGAFCGAPTNASGPTRRHIERYRGASVCVVVVVSVIDAAVVIVTAVVIVVVMFARRLTFEFVDDFDKSVSVILLLVPTSSAQFEDAFWDAVFRRKSVSPPQLVDQVFVTDASERSLTVGEDLVTSDAEGPNVRLLFENGRLDRWE